MKQVNQKEQYEPIRMKVFTFNRRSVILTSGEGEWPYSIDVPASTDEPSNSGA